MPKSARKPTYSQAKKQAWDAFSKFIRLRDIDKPCVTCPIREYWKEMHAGHFLSGRHNSILFEEKNCHKQCVYCNEYLKGNRVVYEAKMLELYGQVTINRLEKLSRQVVKLKAWQLMGIKETYTKKYKKLLAIEEAEVKVL